MQYPMPPHVDPADPLAEQPEWRKKTIGRHHPRYQHLPLVKGGPDGAVEVVRGDPSWAQRLVGHYQWDRLFESFYLTWFVVENRLGDVRLIKTGRDTLVGLIELHQYAAPLDLDEQFGEAETIGELIESLESEADRLRELAADGWELFRYPRTRAQILVDKRRPDEDLSPDDLP